MKTIFFALITVFCLICFMPLYAVPNGVGDGVTDTPDAPATPPPTLPNPSEFTTATTMSATMAMCFINDETEEIEIYDNQGKLLLQHKENSNNIKKLLNNKTDKRIYLMRIKSKHAKEQVILIDNK